MPLLEIVPSKKVTATVSLEEPTANLVNQYAAFTRVAADDVVNKALEYVFTKDKDFQKFIGSPNDSKPMNFWKSLSLVKTYSSALFTTSSAATLVNAAY